MPKRVASQENSADPNNDDEDDTSSVQSYKQNTHHASKPQQRFYHRNCPLYWNTYFPGKIFYEISQDNDEYQSSQTVEEQRDTKNLIEQFTSYFLKNKDKIQIITVSDTEKTVNLDYIGLRDNGPIQDLYTKLLTHPELVISCMEYSLHRVILDPKYQQQQLLETDKSSTSSPTFASDSNKINVRLFNFENTIQLKSLKSSSIGTFVCIKGTVIRSGIIRPCVTEMVFTCKKCGERQRQYFQDGGKFIPPTKCSNSYCKSRIFDPDCSSAKTIDWQRVRIQEILSDDQHEAGRIPRTVEVELTRDMVDCCVPGDQVQVCGIVKVISTEQYSRENGRGGGGNYAGKNATKSMYFLYVEANSISNSKQTEKGQSMDVSFSVKDLFAIRDICNESNLFHFLVNSLCPTIYGQEVVKAGLALTLFGGCQKYTNERDKLTVRGDPHMIIVGDPGLGKSQLLTAVSHLAPRGVYVCGNTTTSTGLTVTVVKDAGSGDYSLEAGALVLADQGCCCIDEFDKMRSEHQSLLEAMEQQSISIAKAGIVCNLPARCSVVAAANPVGGHYNRAKTVSENLKISPALLSRFDLIFILLDSPDDQRDRLLSEHVMRLHAERSISKSQYAPTQAATQVHGILEENELEKTTLRNRLKLDKPHHFDPLPPMLYRKYIAYARKYVHPKLSQEAIDVIQKFYIGLRKIQHTTDTTPVTTRQLESLIRLAQARARMELREVVTEEDAFDVVEIMQESLTDILTDESGQLDFRRSSGTSKSALKRTFLKELHRVSQNLSKAVFSFAEMYQIAKNANLDTSDFQSVVESLNVEGHFISQGNQTYKLLSASTALDAPIKRGRKRNLEEHGDSLFE